MKLSTLRQHRAVLSHGYGSAWLRRNAARAPLANMADCSWLCAGSASTVLLTQLVQDN